jgi:hypothetical protein
MEEMKTVYSFLVIIALLILTSCEMVVEVDIPEQPPLLVFNGNAVADDTLSIFRLTKSRGVLEVISSFQFDPVTDGEIVLYENDIPVDTLHHEVIFDEGDYPTRFIFHSGNTYYIEASGGGLPLVNAFTSVPVVVVPIITSYTPVSFTDQNGNEIAELKFTITDPAPEVNYYHLFLNGRSIYFNSNDPALNINAPFTFGEGFSGVPETFFDDHLFNGQEKSMTVYMRRFDISPTSGVVVELISMDRSGYLYNQSFRLQLNTEGNPFAEPAPVFNNIENGYGVFGSMAVARDTIF